MSKSCSNNRAPLKRGRWWIVVSAIALAAAAAPFVLPIGPTEDLSAKLRRGVAAAERGDWEEFERTVRELGDTPSSVPAAQTLRAVRALKEQRPNDALLLLPAQTDAPGVAALVWPIRVEALFQLGRLREAESHLIAERERDSKNPLVHRWLSIIYYDLGAMDPAVTALRALAELSPDDPSPHLMLGQIFHDYERFNDAVGSLSTFLALPNAPRSHRRDASLRLADSQMRLRQYADAIATLEKLDGSAEVWGRRAECHWNLGEHALAAACVRAGLPLERSEPYVAMMAAQLHVEEQEYDDAIEHLETLLRAEPHHLQGRYLLATCYRNLGDAPRADAALARYEQSQQLRERLAELHRIAVIDKWNAEIRREIASLCDELGRPSLASMWRRAANSCQTSGSLNSAEAETTPSPGNAS